MTPVLEFAWFECKHGALSCSIVEKLKSNSYLDVHEYLTEELIRRYWDE